MKNKFVILAVCAMIASATIAGCGNSTDTEGTSATESSSESDGGTSDISMDDVVKEGSHDSSKRRIITVP